MTVLPHSSCSSVKRTSCKPVFSSATLPRTGVLVTFTVMVSAAAAGTDRLITSSTSASTQCIHCFICFIFLPPVI